MQTFRPVVILICAAFGISLAWAGAAAEISIHTPIDGQTFPFGTDITIEVSTDAHEWLEVQFFANGYWLGTDRSVPYSFRFPVPAIAEYSLTAVGLTHAGIAVTSAPVRIAVTNNFPPLVSLTSPAGGSLSAPGSDVLLTADVLERDGTVTLVEFFANDRKIGEAITGTNSSFTGTWSNVPPGDYVLQAAATDNLGLQGFSTFSTLRASLDTTHPPDIVRGPYLQSASPTNIIIRWRSATATTSRVKYGTNLRSLDSVAGDDVETVDHAVALQGLRADTKYFYFVGDSESVLTAWTNQFFVTRSDSSKTMRIWALGDSGSANVAARAVRNAYYDFNGARSTDLCLMLGDNAYEFGVDGDYQDAVFDMYPPILRQTVLWSTVGNHDVDPAYFNIFNLPTVGESGGVPSGRESYYSFDFGNVHFVSLNSFRENRSTGGPMLTWLRQDLAATAKDWIIAFWHHPPYSHGSHNSDLETELVQMRQNAVPILEEYGADLVLCGHSHSYERSFLLNGHYGSAGTLSSRMILNGGNGRPEGDGPYVKPAGRAGAHRGTIYVVAGSASQFGGGTLDHPAMASSLNQLGSLVLDIDGLRLDAKFVAANGEINDSFTLEKRNPPFLKFWRRRFKSVSDLDEHRLADRTRVNGGARLGSYLDNHHERIVGRRGENQCRIADRRTE